MTPAVLIGIQLALTLLDGVANATVSITKMNAAITLARSEGRAITLEELSEIARGNRALTDEVLKLLDGE
jgi:hypothetical protein